MPTINSVYYGGGQQPNPANVIQVSGAPSTKLTEDPIGTIAIDNSANQSYILSSKLGGTNHWKTVGGGGGTGILDITANTGGPVGADISNNINITSKTSNGVNVTGNALTNTIDIAAMASSTTQFGSSLRATDVQAAAQFSPNTTLSPSNISSMFSTNPLPSNQGGTGYATYNDGEILIGDTASHLLVRNSLTAGSGISITPAAGSITISSTVVPTPSQQQIIYVSQVGNDLNDGLTLATAQATFTAAITTAGFQTPSSTNKFVVYCEDDGIYTENPNGLQWVDIYAPNATLNGHFSAVDDTNITFKQIDVPTGQIGIYKSAGTGTCIANVSRVNCAGTGIGFFCTNGVLQCSWDRLEVTNGFGIGDTTTTQAHTHLNGKDIYISGSGVGVARGNSGSTVGKVDHILNIGAGTGTAIQINTTGTIDINVDVIATTVAYNVSGGLLNLTFKELSGTRTQSGSPTINVWNPKSYGAGGQVMASNGVGLDADWTNFSALIPAQNNIIYVSKVGNNANSGFNIESAKLTFAAAMTAASGASPSPTNRIAVWCFDDGIYAESFAVPAYVDLFAPNATINCDSIVLQGNNNFKLGNVTETLGDSAIQITGSGVNAYVSNLNVDTGICFEAGIGVTAYVKWDTAIVTTGGTMLLCDTNSHLYFDGGTTTLGGTSQFAISTDDSVNSWAIGHCDVVRDITGFDSGLIAVNGLKGNFIMDFDQIVGLAVGPVSQVGCITSITVNDIECTQPWDTASNGGDLQITYNRAIGTPFGSAYVTQPFKWQGTTSSQTMVSQNGYYATGTVTLNLRLPGTSNVNDVIEIASDNATGFVITQTVGQNIIVNGTASTVGVTGQVSGSAGGAVKIICTVAGATWQVLSHEGTLTPS